MTAPLPLKPELQRLLDALIDDTILPPERTALAAMLHADASARHLYCRYLALHQLLQAEFCLPLKLPAALQVSPPRRMPVLGFLGELTSAVERTATRYIRPIVWSVLISSICFSAYVVALVWGMLDEPTGRGLMPEARGSGQQVAAITGSQNAEWQSDKSEVSSLNAEGSDRKLEIRNQPSEIHLAEPLQLASGIVELRLKQGVRLAIEGPAEWEIDGENAATLHRGKLVAMVPEQAIGFTVKTPTATIVDLGTEFGVVVDESNQTEVQVLTGKVEVQTPVAPERLVYANQAIRVQGKSIQPITADRQKFANLRFTQPVAVAAPPEVLAVLGPSKSWNNPRSWADRRAPTSEKCYRLGSGEHVEMRTSDATSSGPFTGGVLVIDPAGMLICTHRGSTDIRDLRLNGGKLVLAKSQAGQPEVKLAGRIRVLRAAKIDLWDGSLRLATTLEGSGNLTVTGPGNLRLSAGGRHYDGDWLVRARGRVSAETLDALGSGSVELVEQSQLVVRYVWEAPAATLRIGDGSKFEFSRDCQLGRVFVNRVELPPGNYTAKELATRFPENFVEGQAVLRVGEASR